ncbi:phosphatase PAP2 family protein [Azospirillum sp. sgz301742]
MSFDLAIIHFLNGFAYHSVTFDKAIYVVAQSHSLKGGVLLACLWWCWSRRTGTLIGADLYAVRTIGGALLAIIVGRLMQNELPLRLRPVHDPSVGFNVTTDVKIAALDGWSSFPSDHAVLFFALSTAVWWSSRRVGAAAYVWTLVVICLPRVYLGLHFPTDILAGAVVGVAVMAVVLRMPLPAALPIWLTRLQSAQPGLLYSAAFVVTLQMATLFEDSRRLLGGVAQVLLGW